MDEDITITNKIRQKILQKLMHSPGSNFNSLWDKDEFESNKFAYHLKNLETEGLIEKKENGYYLSHKGNELAVFLNGVDGSKKKKPLNCTGVIIFDSTRTKVLLHKRKKEPFFGYYGIGAGGKIEYGESLECSAKKELLEETGLTADLRLTAIYNMVTYNNSELSYHHTHFMFEGTKLKGELTTDNRECTFEWVDISYVKTLTKVFPDIHHIIQTVLSQKFKIVELERHMKDDEFVSCEVKKEYNV